MGKQLKAACIAMLLVCLVAIGVSAEALPGAKQRFEVTLIWVNGLSRTPDDLHYAYQFVNRDTGETHALHMDAVNDGEPMGDQRAIVVKAEAMLPRNNQDGSNAVYLLSPLESGYLMRDGVGYFVATSESEDPAAGAPFFSRLRVLTQQINPLVDVRFEGVAFQPFALTLSMQSWAGQERHQASKTITSLPMSGLNLLEVFAEPTEAALFRHFGLVELSWDGTHLAGENSFSLEAEPPAGLVSQVSGNADEGFHILFTKAQ